LASGADKYLKEVQYVRETWTSKPSRGLDFLHRPWTKLSFYYS